MQTLETVAHPVIFAFTKIPFQSTLHIAELPSAIHGNSYIKKQCYYLPPLSWINLTNLLWYPVETLQVQWLITHFNYWFAHHETILVNGLAIGKPEPEYFAKTEASPAKIVFAHGFFASGLHEISHWCVAGKKRRQLDDFGYWYAADGRSQVEQALFEQVEIIPQAIECLLTLSCGKNFKVSLDNLCADFDTSKSTFAQNVCEQAVRFWQTGEKLPTDANVLIQHLQRLRPMPLTEREIRQNFILI